MTVELQDPGPLLRPLHELRAAAAWAGAALWLLLAGLGAGLPPATWMPCVLLAALRSGWRMFEARTLLRYRWSLGGKPTALMPVESLRSALPAIGPHLWLGWGFRWEARHTRRALEILGQDRRRLELPGWCRWLFAPAMAPQQGRGLAWIHGLDMQERDVLLPFDSLRGHCAVIATTGALKTRLAALVIFQVALRGDCVIVIDPKGDRELREICRSAAALSGRPDRFLMFHPAFASESVRLDLIKNWDRVSQVASRITMVLDAAEGDSFREFCWMAVHRITNALKYLGRRVSLHALKKGMETRAAVESLTEEAMRFFFAHEGAVLAQRLEQQVNALRADPASRRPPKGALEAAPVELSAMIKVFREWQAQAPGGARDTARVHGTEELNGLLAILEANREWFGKMIVSITPLLTKLTTDDLRDLLSPDYADLEDPRPIMDMRRIVEGEHILYIGTDTLADESVGHAISTMALADLSAVAAEIYNHGTHGDRGDERRRVHVVIDEWGDAVCAPVIQQANKGRGAGFFIWALGQTFSDLVDRFGNNAARAKRFIGNMNNLVVGATQDPDTMDLITEKLGETTVLVQGHSAGFGSKTEDLGLEFSAQNGASLSEREKELFPRSLLPCLPDLHYIGFFNRGELVKGRIPVLLPGAAAPGGERVQASGP